MKTKWIVFLSLNFLFSYSAFSKKECSNYLNGQSSVAPVVLQEPAREFKPEDLIDVTVVKTANIPRVKLEPVLTKDGDTYWGYYECSNCSNEVSAKPGERRCIGCGKSHSDEPLDEIAPAMFRKTERIGDTTYHNLYLVNPGRLSNDRAMKRLADEGVADECPFCGVTDFDLSVGCTGCGAETDDANDIRKYALRKLKASLKASTRISSADAELAKSLGVDISKDVSAPVSASNVTIAQIDAELKDIDAENKKRSAGGSPRIKEGSSIGRASTQSEVRGLKQRLMDKIHFTKRGAMILAASTLIATTPIGYIWGTTSYTHMAEVIEISRDSVTVEYFKTTGQTEDVVLHRPSGEVAQWHMGEQVELYFVNWKMGNPSGGERGNGDVLKPKN